MVKLVHSIVLVPIELAEVAFHLTMPVEGELLQVHLQVAAPVDKVHTVDHVQRSAELEVAVVLVQYVTQIQMHVQLILAISTCIAQIQ